MTIKVEVFTQQNCPYCPKAIHAAEVAKEELGDQIEYVNLDVSENMDKVNEYNLMSVPSIVIDGEVAFTNPPEPKDLVKKLKKKILRQNRNK